MMFGSKVRYGITFKQGEKIFTLYRRKYQHNMKVCVDDSNYEGGISIVLPKAGKFLVAKIDQVLIYDNQTFQQCGKIPITLMKADSREPNQIIGLVASKDEKWVAIISGKNLVMNQQA